MVQNPVAGFGVTFKAMFKKRLTEQYPEQQKTTAPRFHGRHQLNRHPDGLEKCIGCELCAWACPADAIYVEGADNTDEERYSPGERYGARLPDQLRPLHPVRPVHRGVPDARADDDERVRAGRHQPREPHLHQGAAARRPRRGHGRLARTRSSRARTSRTTTGAWSPRPRPARSGRSPSPRARSPRRGGRGRHERAARRMSALAATTSTGEAFQFWVLGTVAVIGALCTILMKRAVHSALCLAGTMIILAVFYLANGAYFLGVVQIVVYTGAIMMLFLFVVMLVGVTAADSLKETIKGQRWLAAACGLGFGILLIAGIGNASLTDFNGLGAANARRQRRGPRGPHLHQVRLRLRDHRRAADHGGRRRHGAHPPRAHRARQDPARAGRGARTRGQAPAAAARARRLRPAQRGGHRRACCPTAPRPSSPSARRCASAARSATCPREALDDLKALEQRSEERLGARRSARLEREEASK